jgi:guanylate kinase
MTNSEIGTLYVIAAPSGTGKTTLVKALVDSTPKVTVSISHTTRPKRPAEIEEINYHFVDQATFEQMIAHGDFLEYATIFGNLYGTSKTWVMQTLAKGIDVILEIDWQGHQQILRLFPDCVDIFILPPSLASLRERLVNRNQDHPEVIEQRLADVRQTITHIHEFKYVVINDNFQYALEDLRSIITAGRLLQKRQAAKYSELVAEVAHI